MERADTSSAVDARGSDGHRSTRGERWQAEAEEGCACQWCETIRAAIAEADKGETEGARRG